MVLLGNGRPDFIEAFSQRNHLGDKPVTILTDPSLEVYQYAGLQRSAWATFGPKSVVGFAKALAKGNSQSKLEGDSTQQGGLIILDEAGKVRFLYRNKDIGDHADTGAVMSVALSMAAKNVDSSKGRV